MADLNQGGMPKSGHVNEVYKEWLVREDGALAYRLQSKEIDEFYQGNKYRNAVVRQDFPTALNEQIKEKESADKQVEQRQRILSEQEIADAQYARQLSEKLQKTIESEKYQQNADNENIAKKLQRIYLETDKGNIEKNVKIFPSEEINVKKHQNLSHSLESNVRYPENLRETASCNRKPDRKNQSSLDKPIESGSSSILSNKDKNLHKTSLGKYNDAVGIIETDNSQNFKYIDRKSNKRCNKKPWKINHSYSFENNDYDLDNAKITQELKDEELARMLQSQEQGELLSQEERDRLLAIEAQDKEFARMLQEREKAKARRAKEKARLKKQLRHSQPPSLENHSFDNSIQPYEKDEYSNPCDLISISNETELPKRYDESHKQESLLNLSLDNPNLKFDNCKDDDIYTLPIDTEKKVKNINSLPKTAKSQIKSTVQSDVEFCPSSYNVGAQYKNINSSVLPINGPSNLAPPYMPVQGTRRNLSTDGKKKKPKDKCTHQ